MKVSARRFRKLVGEAMDELPEVFRRHLDNVEVVVAEEPSPEVQEEFPGVFLLGLYQGTPLVERSVVEMSLPDIISIYKRNIEEVCSTEEEIREEVRRTLLHEIGHHFGLSEEELEEIEEGWR